MKNIRNLSPFIILVLAIVVAVCFLIPKKDEGADKTVITSSTLTEVLSVSNLSSAKYIHNGVARATIEGKFDGYVMYYAVVKPNIDFSAITFEVDDDGKTVTATIPQDFNFEVEVLTDKGIHTSPQKNDLTAKDVIFICEKDAQDKAQANAELMQVARENLGNSIKALLDPLLRSSGYTLVLE